MKPHPRSDLPSWALLVFGLLSLLALGVWIARSHEADRPPELAPKEIAPEKAPIPAQGSLPKDSRWRLIHVLAPGCSYSEGVARDLLRRGVYFGRGAQERVVWLGAAPEIASRLAWSGWDVRVADLHGRNGCRIGGAPWLLVFDPAGSLRYSGRYPAGRAVAPEEIGQLAAVGEGDLMPSPFRADAPGVRWGALDQEVEAQSQALGAVTSAAR
ncbi:MAG TPA: hypothetical protein VIM58_11250 [Candidatus Methylacidiphilales bacterium]